MAKNPTNGQPGETIHKIIEGLDKERELSRKCLVEIEKKWKAILSEEKLESLRKAFDVLKGRYGQEVQNRNETIKHLSHCFEHAEDQRRTAVASHLEILDEMIHLHYNQLSTAERCFLESIEEVRDRYQKERQQILDRYEIDKNTLMDEISGHEKQERRMADKETRDQQEELEEIRNKNLEDINSLRFILDTRIEDLDEHFELAKNEYLQKTDFQSDSLQMQVLKSEEMNSEVAVLQRKIDKLCFALRKIRMISNRKSLQNQDRYQQLMRRKSEIISRYKNTKITMDDLRLTQHGKLKGLTIKANSQKLELEEEFRVAEKVMKLVKMISKLEKQDDSVLQADNHLSSYAMFGFDTNNILNRYNKALLHYEEVQKEEKRVLEVNKDLKEKIRKFKDGITVNDQVILSSNPLLVVNGKMCPESSSNSSFTTTTSGKTVIPSRRMTVVDANHAFSISHAR